MLQLFEAVLCLLGVLEPSLPALLCLPYLVFVLEGLYVMSVSSFPDNYSIFCIILLGPV